MRKALLGVLMAAGTLLPALATAQEEETRMERRVREAQPDVEVSRGEPSRPPAPVQWQRPAGEERGSRGGGGERPRPEPRPDVQAPPAPAQAWNRGDGQRREGNRPDWNRGGDGQRPAWRGGEDRPVVSVQPARQQDRPGNERRDWNRNNGNGRPDWAGNGGWNPGARDDDRRREEARRGNGYRPAPPSAGWQRDRADWNDRFGDERRFDNRSAWNRGWRSDNRYDWNRYRTVNRGLYHLPRYYAPYGWGNGYRRFGIGVRLNAILFGQNYWIDDPWDYRLPPVYGPYRWVRYYNDALLVDVHYGEVVDVVYDIFW